MPISKLTLPCLALSAALFAPAAGCTPPVDLSVESYTSDLSGFGISNHLIMGEKEAILVDASFFRADAEKVVSMIRASGKTLKLIWLTHAHPDHYFGLDIVLGAFPGTPIYSSPEVVANYNAIAQGVFQGSKTMYGAMIADKLAPPTEYREDKLSLEGEELRIVKIPEGESQVATALYAPRQKLLFSGDTVGNNAYVWTAECKLDQIRSNITLLKNNGPVDKLYPGHGKSPGGPEAFDADMKYVQDVAPILSTAATAMDAVTQIKAKYPSLDAGGILSFSTQLYYMSCRR